MVNVSFIGLGRMGGAAARLAAADPGIKIVSGVEFNGGSAAYPIYTPDKLELAIKDAEVVVDFTNPEACAEAAVKALGMGKKVVIGTTGFSDAQLAKIEAAVKRNNGVAVMAPNFSIGVNMFFKFASEMAAKLPEYDVEIIEWHHNQKKDAPSGTAAKIAKMIKDARAQNDELVYGRSGLSQRKKNEIGVHAVRAGDIVGIHSVWFVGNNEEIELRHSAHSRDAFASGCVKAIKWLSKKAGTGKIYGMADVIGI